MVLNPFKAILLPASLRRARDLAIISGLPAAVTAILTAVTTIWPHALSAQVGWLLFCASLLPALEWLAHRFIDIRILGRKA